MYTKVETNNNYTNELGTEIIGASYYLCESEDDVAKLPTEGVGVGSRALVIITGDIYMLGGSRKWLKYKGVSVMN